MRTLEIDFLVTRHKFFPAAHRDELGYYDRGFAFVHLPAILDYVAGWASVCRRRITESWLREEVIETITHEALHHAFVGEFDLSDREHEAIDALRNPKKRHARPRTVGRQLEEQAGGPP